jgi:hypothetical protein
VVLLLLALVIPRGRDGGEATRLGESSSDRTPRASRRRRELGSRNAVQTGYLLQHGAGRRPPAVQATAR